MASTPHCQDISEDSGCLTLTVSETSASIAEGTSSTQYVETPTTSSMSRKRKFSYFETKIHKRVLESFCETSTESPALFGTNHNNPPNFLSSTLNESLSKSLEKCNLGTYTPNFYIERSPSEFDSQQCLKRYRLDESPQYQPKTRSAPSTPTKHLEEDEFSFAAKAWSEQLAGYYFTPDRGAEAKLGTSERLALLYPSLRPTPSPTKLKTPEKLREFIKKVNSPAKKRLFENAQVEKRVFRKVHQDPVVVFTVKNDFRHIISKIFEYLSDGDLCTVSKVCKTWRRALHSDHKAFPRYYSYSREYSSNKENILRENSFNERMKLSPPPSPERDNFHRCTRIVSRLSPSQSLQKCPRCMQPAVLQRSISQCQNPNCEYISCTNCLSFSITGPENFIDKCQTSELLVASKDSFNRYGLYDISNATGESPSFLLGESFDTTQSKYDSSGYLSENDFSPIVQRRLSLNVDTKPLQPVSLNRVDSLARRSSRRSSLVSVVSARTTPKIAEAMEPSSPPRIKAVACSTQSKKNLKRLRF